MILPLKQPNVAKSFHTGVSLSSEGWLESPLDGPPDGGVLELVASTPTEKDSEALVPTRC